MSLIQRAKNMILAPRTEWDVAAAEATPPAQLVTGYVLPLAAAYSLATFIGTAMVIGFFAGMAGVGWALVGAIYHLVMAVVMVFVLAAIIDALAPTFAGQKSFPQAMKVAAYSYTPVWVFGLLTIIPFLGWIAVLVGVLYAIYLLYLGLPRLMKAPEDKAVPYVVVVIIIGIVIGIVVGMVGGMLVGVGGPHLGRYGASSVAPYDRDSRLGRLNEFAAKMDAANKRVAEAEKSGDSQKQMDAAMAAFGTAISGGKGIEPVQLDVLKPMLPEQFLGLPRTSQRADRSGIAGIMAAKVEGDYGDSGASKRVHLAITDTGGASGLVGLAAWANLGASAESEDDSHIERMRRDGKRLIREEISKNGGPNSYSVILGDRFVVDARGRGVDAKEMAAAVNALDLAKLEAMK